MSPAVVRAKLIDRPGRLPLAVRLDKTEAVGGIRAIAALQVRELASSPLSRILGYRPLAD